MDRRHILVLYSSILEIVKNDRFCLKEFTILGTFRRVYYFLLFLKKKFTIWFTICLLFYYEILRYRLLFGCQKTLKMHQIEISQKQKQLEVHFFIVPYR